MTTHAKRRLSLASGSVGLLLLCALPVFAPSTRADVLLPSPAGSDPVSGHVVDYGRCMDVLHGSDAAATRPSSFALVSQDTGERWIYAEVDPTQPRALLTWMRAHTMPGRTAIAVPERWNGEQVAWQGLCVVTHPLLPAAELTLGAPVPRTDSVGVTRSWRSLTISANGRAELEFTLGHHVVFLDASGGFHGMTTVARLLDANPDSVFF
ncbi:MAG: hypothetical protein IPL19_11810 [Sandaracinaceae bacterium]|nr:hypothetical protein [Sandaracinaceae bacterium]MBK8408656.1 hypothetical protein [Sandaracinaceae bacterium]MBK8592047.1 hypothetical protein [Sandaracinaceae bacterium]MBP7683483.1 hypothetical protein [Deltaproteobacteria bacterium]